MNWDWDEFIETFGPKINISGPISDIKSVHGGCINETYSFAAKPNQKKYFLKLNDPDLAWMFEAEFDALLQIHESIGNNAIIKCPKPILSGESGGHSFLLLEHIDFSKGPGRSNDYFALGKGLAELHAIDRGHFGWHRDNTIGSTPQPNPKSMDWIQFWSTHRLEHQARLAYNSGFRIDNLDWIIPRTDELFQDYLPVPSLIHGDLWSGNAGFDKNGKPVIFDPASYFADREAEFGIIHMFGGFPDPFFHGYDSVLKRRDDFSRRKALYQIYHELNHLNLFGSSYLSSVQSSVNQIKNELI